MSTIKNSVYGLIDLVTLNKGIARKINDYSIRFPAKWSRYFESNYEKENVEFLTKTCKKDMTVIDIGAHLGLISVIIAKLVGEKGQVHSFEPTPATFTLLKKIISLNNFEKIIYPHNKAVSNFNGLVDFFVDANEGSNANSLVARKDKSRESQKIKVDTLDNIVKELKLEKLDLVKIDAEGSEQDVLNGAKETIKTFAPIIILAIHPALIKNNNQNTADIFDIIHSFNYTVYYKEQVLSKEAFCNNSDFFDVHLIPETKK
ncbi:MAG: FkbM family methyltransferase [Bacteroidetes bacterium]|nr:FkbM family methyltransferase [Bacteroidota bacterium]